MAGIFNANIFNAGIFNGAEADFKAGTGGADPEERKRKRKKLHLPYKPTGLLDRPKAKDVRVQERLDDSVDIQAEIAGRLAKEFEQESDRIEAKNIVEMSMAEVDREIGILLQKKLRTEEEEMMLMLFMVAATA